MFICMRFCFFFVLSGIDIDRQIVITLARRRVFVFLVPFGYLLYWSGCIILLVMHKTRLIELTNFNDHVCHVCFPLYYFFWSGDWRFSTKATKEWIVKGIYF